MKFELRPPRKRFSDSELLDDLKRVAHALQKLEIDQKEYRRHGGRHAAGTFAERLGSWHKALSQAGLKPARRLPATEEDLLDDLRRVSRELGKPSVTIDEYERVGRFSREPFSRVFGSWVHAVKKAGLSHSENFHPRISDEKLFQNLERIWIALGRQPAYLEIERPLSDHSVTTYERRFGSWRGALDAFVSYVNEPIANGGATTRSSPPRSPASIATAALATVRRACTRCSGERAFGAATSALRDLCASEGCAPV